MITAWRIVQARHRDTAFTGAGARDFPGRWHPRGIPVVYTAGSLALAALEMLVHLHDQALLGAYTGIPVTFDPSHCLRLAPGDLPADWNRHPAPASTRALGTRWVREGGSPVLAVPSAVIPLESVYLLNPAHPRFHEVRIGEAIPFYFDPRLSQRG